MSKKKCKHLCYCGTGSTTPHVVGEGGCVRFLTKAPVPDGDGWVVDGHHITNYTLKHQRGYHQYECGCWSRWPGSTNLLSDET